jgi:hypothetical protein
MHVLFAGSVEKNLNQKSDKAIRKACTTDHAIDHARHAQQIMQGMRVQSYSIA